MTPSQQSALESLAARSLSSAEIALASARNDSALASSISVGLTRTASKRIGIGSVLDALGAANGAAFLDAMSSLSSSISAIKWGLALLNAGDFDVGSPTAIGIINLLVTGGTLGSATVAANTIPQATATALLGLASVPAPIDVNQISNILNG